VISGGGDKRSQKTVQLTPMTGRGSHGLALSGSF
jgi:hypothetical protein